MVAFDRAVVSSTITAGLITAVHGAAHYYVAGPERLGQPDVMAAGAAVFVSAWLLSYGGMRGYLPF